MFNRFCLFVLASNVFASGALAAIIETVPVGDVGNAGDMRVMVVGGATSGYGRVDYAYNIGKYEVTAGQTS